MMLNFIKLLPEDKVNQTDRTNVNFPEPEIAKKDNRLILYSLQFFLIRILH
jgi:hypothetical protein